MGSLRVGLCIAAVGAACSWPAGTPTGDAGRPAVITPPPDGPLRGPCAAGTRLGMFAIDRYDDWIAVSGSVEPRLDPFLPGSAWRPVLTEGACTLEAYQTAVCQPACPWSTACGTENQCRPFIGKALLGVVTVLGLGADLYLERQETGQYYGAVATAAATSAPGDRLGLTSVGSTFEPFVLRGRAVEPVVPIGDATGRNGEPLSLAWAPGSDPEGRIFVLLNVGGDIGPPFEITCEFPDTGSAQIPAALVSAYRENAPGLDNSWGIGLSRRTADSVQVAEGCVELQVKSVAGVRRRREDVDP